jgi:hypothetical protein
VGQLQGALDVCLRGAGQELEVDVSRKAVPGTDQLHAGDHLVHGPIDAAAHTRAEKDPIHQVRAAHPVKGTGQFLGLEAAAGLVATGAHGAIVAVSLADVGHQDLEDPHPLAIGQGGGIDPAAEIVPGARSSTAGVAQVVLGGLTQGFKLLLDVHPLPLCLSLYAQMF